MVLHSSPPRISSLSAHAVTVLPVPVGKVRNRKRPMEMSLVEGVNFPPRPCRQRKRKFFCDNPDEVGGQKVRDIMLRNPPNFKMGGVVHASVRRRTVRCLHSKERRENKNRKGAMTRVYGPNPPKMVKRSIQAEKIRKPNFDKFEVTVFFIAIR
jgi:hypothetical protein